MPISEEQARKLLETLPKERWSATINTLLVETLRQNEALARALGETRKVLNETREMLSKVAKGAFALSKEVKALRDGVPVDGEDPVEQEGYESAPDVVTPAPTVGADGQPLSQEQAEIEAQMAAAIATEMAEKRRVGRHAPPQITKPQATKKTRVESNTGRSDSNGNGRPRPAASTVSTASAAFAASVTPTARGPKTTSSSTPVAGAPIAKPNTSTVDQAAIEAQMDAAIAGSGRNG